MRKLLLLAMSALLGCAPLMAADGHSSRHLVEMEFLAPLGTHTVGDLFRALSKLNKGQGEFPQVKDERPVTLRPGRENRNYVISAQDLVDQLGSQVKLFHRDYRIEISRRFLRIFKVGDLAISQPQEAENDLEAWKRNLPRIEEKIVIAKGEEATLKSGFYKEKVTIQGKAELSEGDAVFQDLSVQGTLEIKGNKVQGENLSSEGHVELDQQARVEFKKVETGGDIKLEEGAHLTTKKFHFNKNGRLILNKDSHLILN